MSEILKILDYILSELATAVYPLSSLIEKKSNAKRRQ